MRKFLIAGLMATSLLPVAAQAQISPRERAELRNDRRDIREERRDVRDARRFGDQQDVRRERRDVREARQEFREDRRDAVRDGGRNWGRNDWRGYRAANRDLYRGGAWRSNFRYQTFRPGARIGVGLFAPRYYINDFGRYRLPRPGFNQRWVRHYNDVILVDIRRGIVIDAIRGFYW